MHIKAVPAMQNVANGAGSFIGKHKVLLIGGVAALVIGYAITQAVTPVAQTPTASSNDGALGSTAFTPVSLGGGGGGGGSIDGSGGSLASGGGDAASSLAASVTSAFQGAFGTYSGLASDIAAQFDLARLGMEQNYNARIYEDTLNSNAITQAMNLNAYSIGTGYGVNAGAVNNAFLTSLVNAGVTDANAINSVLTNLYGNNPVTPNVNYNGGQYYNVGGGNGPASIINQDVNSYTPQVNNTPAQTAPVYIINKSGTETPVADPSPTYYSSALGKGKLVDSYSENPNTGAYDIYNG